MFLRDKIYRNPSINQLKAIAKNSEEKSARFNIIDYYGTLNKLNPKAKLDAGDAFIFYHHGLTDIDERVHTKGFINYIPEQDKFVYAAFLNPTNVGGLKRYDSDHPALEKFEKRGITRDNSLVPWEWVFIHDYRKNTEIEIVV